MISRLSIPHDYNTNMSYSMLQDYRDIPGIGEQVDYLMNTCQVKILSIKLRIQLVDLTCCQHY